MEDIYLTSSGKRKYMDDFMNNVLSFNKIEFWKLDEGLPAILTGINSNDHVQTLYSKRPSYKNPDSYPLSYLELCYTAEIELYMLSAYQIVFTRDKLFVHGEDNFYLNLEHVVKVLIQHK
jgi:hypothetical protein